MMNKIIVIFGICSLSLITNGQEKHKLIFGGNISGDLGRFNDRIEISPTLHTKIFPKVYLGIGAILANYKQESIGYLISENEAEVIEYDIKTRTTYYGANLFARYYPLELKRNFAKNLFIQAELELLKGNGKYSDLKGDFKFTTDNSTLFTGIGYKHLLKNRFALNLSLLFKLNNESDSPYRNPILRIGFEF